jgi:hypothetical protein
VARDGAPAGAGVVEAAGLGVSAGFTAGVDVVAAGVVLTGA